MNPFPVAHWSGAAISTGPTLVNQAYGYDTPTGAFNLVAGNALIVCVGVVAGNTMSITSITDTAGNTYTPTTVRNLGNVFYTFCAYAVGCIGHASNVITVTLSLPSGGHTAVQAFQYSGVTAYDAQAGTTSGGTTCAATLTTTAAGAAACVVSTNEGAPDTFLTPSTPLVYQLPSGTHTSFAAFTGPTASAISTSFSIGSAGASNRSMSLIGLK